MAKVRHRIQNQTEIPPYAQRQLPEFDAERARKDNSVGKKIAALRKDNGYTLDRFAALLKHYGVSAGRSAINKWETGETLPSIYQLMAVCKALETEGGLSCFMEEAAKQPLNETGLRKLADYREDLIASGRYRAARYADGSGIRYLAMPVSELRASAGAGAFLSEDSFSEELFPEGSVKEGAEFGIRIRGDSMEPVYHDGQIVWVQRCDSLRPGEVGIFLYDESGYIKVYGEQEPPEEERSLFTDSYGTLRMQPVLVSYNPAYAPKPVSPYKSFRIAGRVL